MFLVFSNDILAILTIALNSSFDIRCVDFSARISFSLLFPAPKKTKRKPFLKFIVEDIVSDFRSAFSPLMIFEKYSFSY